MAITQSHGETITGGLVRQAVTNTPLPPIGGRTTIQPGRSSFLVLAALRFPPSKTGTLSAEEDNLLPGRSISKILGDSVVDSHDP